MASSSSAVLMLGNFLLRYRNPSNISYPMAFTKHLINSSFMWRGRKDIFMGLTRGKCCVLFSWRLSLPWLPVTFDVMLCSAVERLSQRNKKKQNFEKSL